MIEATARGRHFVHNLIAGMNGFKAAEAAGYPESMCRNLKWEVWNKRRVRRYYREKLLEIAPPETVVRRIGAMLDSKDMAVSWRGVQLAIMLWFLTDLGELERAAAGRAFWQSAIGPPCVSPALHADFRWCSAARFARDFTLVRFHGANGATFGSSKRHKHRKSRGGSP